MFRKCVGTVILAVPIPEWRNLCVRFLDRTLLKAQLLTYIALKFKTPDLNPIIL